MTVLEKIEYLMKKNGLNKRQFSLLSDIPYSTLNNLLLRGTDSMRLPTFIRICDFFGVTMDSMAYDEMDIVFKKDVAPEEYTPDEKSIIHSFRYLGEEGKKRVLYTLDMEKTIETEKKKEIASA